MVCTNLPAFAYAVTISDNRVKLLNCREIIMSEEYGDFILIRNLAGVNPLKLPISCEFVLNETYKVAYAKLPEDRSMLLEDAGYTAIPKLYGLMDTESMEAAGILRVQTQPGLALTGKDTIVGVIDTGERVIMMSG